MTDRIALVNPATLERAIGYAHGATVNSGRLLVIAGQVAHDKDGRMIGKGDLVAQFRLPSPSAQPPWSRLTRSGGA